MKKIEIIIEKRFFEELADLMNQDGIENYSVIEISKGHGDKHGDILDYGFISVDANLLIVVLCDDHEAALIKEKVVPYIREIDGMIYKSEIELWS